MSSNKIKISDIERNELDKINENMRKGRFEKVIELSANAKKKYPRQIFFHLSHSIGNSQLGNSTEALRILMDAEKLFPEDYELLFQTAKVYEDMDLFEKAEEYFMRSYEATPADNYEAKSDCMNDIGVIKYNQGKEDEADELFKNALELNPQNLSALENLYMLDDEYEEEDNYFDEFNEDIKQFKDIQQKIYLKKHNRKKFKSKEEEDRVNLHIIAEWADKIAGQMDLILSLNKKEKTKWFKSVRIDFSGEPPDIEMPVIEVPVYKEMSEKLNLLPPNGVSYVMLAFPFLEAAGISEDEFNDMIDSNEISDDDKSKINWACKIGERIFRMSDMKSDSDLNNRIEEILSIASQHLSGDKPEEAFRKVMNSMMK